MELMEQIATPLLVKLLENSQILLVSLDQTAIGDDRAIAMISVRFGERALPLFWYVADTKGNIAIKDYLPLLDRLKKCLPETAQAIVLADRFFGSPQLIKACQTHKFQYRIRLKGNLTTFQNGGEMKVDEMIKTQLKQLVGVGICGEEVVTNIGYLHENGHPEPWFIAMDVVPTETTIREYGLRWGIEAMFSDYKSRGFGLEDTHLRRVDRISRLLLVLAISIYWAVVNGYQVQKKTLQNQ